MQAQVQSSEFYGDRTIYKIPEANLPRFEKELAKLSKRSERLIGRTIEPIVFSSYMEEMRGQSIKIVEVYLAAEMPVIDGWTFVARIDHTNESGNIIRSIPNTSVTIPDRFRSAAADCQHCNVRRLRRDTFVLCNEAGEFQQVGTSCLQDFFGHDPYKIAKLAELLGYANEVARAGGEYGEAVLTDRRWINVENFLRDTARVVMTQGWVSAKAARETGKTSTRMLAELDYDGYDYENRPNVDGDAVDALVAGALAWGEGLGDNPRNDYEHNVSVIAKSPYCERRSLGIAASIVGVFYENQRRNSGASAKVTVGDMSGLVTMFATAKVRAPKISLQLPSGQPLMLTVAGPTAAQPGTINVTDGGSYGNNIWFGRVGKDGVWSPSNKVHDVTMKASVAALLTAMAADPEGTARAFGKVTGKCCVCRIPLTDERSVSAGYGATCARNMGWSYPK